jgi:hypothetical protein
MIALSAANYDTQRVDFDIVNVTFCGVVGNNRNN